MPSRCSHSLDRRLFPFSVPETYIRIVGHNPKTTEQFQEDITPVCDAPRAELVARLFREHNDALVSLLALRLRSLHDAKEVAQEAYVRLLQLDRSDGAISLLRSRAR